MFSKLLYKYKGFSQFKRNVLSGVIFSGANTIVTFISYPIYLHFLSMEQFGVWATVSVVLTFTQFGQLGIGTAIIKFIAGEYGGGNFKGITEYTTTAFIILAVPACILFGLVVLFHSYIATFLNIHEVLIHDGARLVFWVGLLSIFSFFVNTIRGVVVGIGRLDVANYVLLFSRLLQIGIAIVLLLFGYKIWSLYIAYAVYFISSILMWTMYLAFIEKIEVLKFNAFRKKKMYCLMKFGGTFSVGMIANIFVMPFNKVVIARYIGLSEVASFQIATQVIMAVRNIFVKGLEAILPKVSEIKKGVKGSVESILAVHNKGMKFIYLCALPIFGLLFIFADFLLQLWLQDMFDAQIVMALQILIVGWFINILAVPDYYMFMGIGKVNYCTVSSLMQGSINVLFVSWIVLMNSDVTLKSIILVHIFALSMASFYLKVQYLLLKYRRLIWQ